MVQHTVKTPQCPNAEKCSRFSPETNSEVETTPNFTISRVPRNGEHLQQLLDEDLKETLEIPCGLPIECKCGKKCENPTKCKKGFKECKQKIVREKSSKLLDPKSGIIVSLPRVEYGKDHKWVRTEPTFPSRF